MASETANNAADQTAFIPTLTLGVPGSPTMALILGVLLIHGISPGPTMITQRPDMLGAGHELLDRQRHPRASQYPLHRPVDEASLYSLQILYPIIITFICIGVFTINNSAFNIWLVAALGALGYALKYFDLPPAPLVLGFVLGPIMEENFRRAMLMSRGDPAIFFERPVSATFVGLIGLFFAVGLVLKLRNWRKQSRIAEASAQSA